MEEFSYRSNSHKSKEEAEKRDIQKIVSGQVVKRKKSGIQRLIGTLMAEDSDNLGTSVMDDIVIPVIKEAIANLFENGSGLVNTLLFGDSRRGKKTGTGSNISYRSYYEQEKQRTPVVRNTYDFDDIVISSRGEAEEVLDKLYEIISVYGAATVADFYELVGVTGQYTDNKYGWTDLHGASIARVRSDGGYGYIIRLPKVRPLD